MAPRYVFPPLVSWTVTSRLVTIMPPPPAPPLSRSALSMTDGWPRARWGRHSLHPRRGGLGGGKLVDGRDRLRPGRTNGRPRGGLRVEAQPRSLVRPGPPGTEALPFTVAPRPEVLLPLGGRDNVSFQDFGGWCSHRHAVLRGDAHGRQGRSGVRGTRYFYFNNAEFEAAARTRALPTRPTRTCSKYTPM